MKRRYIFVSMTGEIYHLKDDFGSIVVKERVGEWYFRNRPHHRFKIGEPVEEDDSFIGVYRDNCKFPDLWLEHLSLVPEEFKDQMSLSTADILPEEIIKLLNDFAIKNGKTVGDLLDDFLEEIGYYNDDDDEYFDNGFE